LHGDDGELVADAVVQFLRRSQPFLRHGSESRCGPDVDIGLTTHPDRRAGGNGGCHDRRPCQRPGEGAEPRPSVPRIDEPGHHVAGMLGPGEAVTDLMPGTAAGSLAGALGVATQDDGNGTPGVLTVLEAAPAGWLVAAYVVVFAGIALALVRRRDVT
jgi:hypothetical protein